MSLIVLSAFLNHFFSDIISKMQKPGDRSQKPE
jgi:hypothetical protein